MKHEHRAWSPQWLEYSGLPQLLAEKVRGGAGWPVFKKIVELDCAVNSEPGTVEATLVELGARCGVEAPAVRKALLSLRKLKLIAVFLPDDDEEVALIKLRTPLQTPVTVQQIKDAHARIFADTPQHFRYVDDYEPSTEETTATDPLLQEIVDLYFNAVGLKMNAFVLDELRLVRQRFPSEMVRRTFRRAQQNEIRSLHWVVQELVRQKKKSDEESGSESA
ncbi:MAG: hypothetical protein ACR2IE_04650 [Candidatus Sumerlaeaceae bacterium]